MRHGNKLWLRGHGDNFLIVVFHIPYSSRWLTCLVFGSSLVHILFSERLSCFKFICFFALISRKNHQIRPRPLPYFSKPLNSLRWSLMSVRTLSQPLLPMETFLLSVTPAFRRSLSTSPIHLRFGLHIVCLGASTSESDASHTIIGKILASLLSTWWEWKSSYRRSCWTQEDRNAVAERSGVDSRWEHEIYVCPKASGPSLLSTGALSA